jgi:shikimate kinase
MNIVLTGPMGSGKTSVGSLVADFLDMKLVDTDDLVVKKTGMSINEIFAGHGEESFREYEERVVEEVSKLDNCVIATGGGVVLSPGNMRRLRRNGIIINLKASLKTLTRRLKGKKDRPLLIKSIDELKKYSEGRELFYKNADFIIDTSDIGVKDVAERVICIAKMPVIRICGCVAGSNPSGQIRLAEELGASMVELRLDLIPDADISSLVKMSSLPVIATDRKNEDSLIEAIEVGCDYVDVEVDSPAKEEVTAKAKSNGCRVIVSMHDFEKTPESFTFEKGDADIFKISTMVNSLEDCRRLLFLLKERDDLIVIGMGELGVFTRVIAPLLGSYLTYASILKGTAPGQLNVKTLYEIYREMGLR